MKIPEKLKLVVDCVLLTIIRTLLIIVGALLVTGVCMLLYLVHRFTLLSIYTVILLLPLLYCFFRRGVYFWQRGLRRVPGLGRTLYAKTALAFVTLTVLIYSLELWRGKMAYAKLAREVEAKGGSLELKALIPPPVRDDQNFCATPLLAELMDYDLMPFPSDTLGNPEKSWRNPNAVKQLKSIQLPRLKPGEDMIWLQCAMTDLNDWQKRLSKDTNFSFQLNSNSPAADNVLLALAKYDKELAELHAASKRPASRWALHYQDGWFMGSAIDDREPFLTQLVKILSLRAAAELASNQSDAALDDYKLALRITDSTRQEPAYFAQLRRSLLLLRCLQPVWEGLANRKWSETQLLEIEASLAPFDLQSDRLLAIRSEIILTIDLYERLDQILSPKTIVNSLRDESNHNNQIPCLWAGLMWAFYPHGWKYQDEVYLYKYCERHIANLPTAAPVEPGKNLVSGEPLPEDPFFTVFHLPKMREIINDRDTFENTQISLLQARLACALERYRLAQGEFPETLDALMPQFVQKLPTAFYGHGPLLGYRRTTNGHFLLYPAGMTNVSESFPKNKNARSQYFWEGDGVWRYPAKH
jgi:hypothetical protein